MNRVDYADTHPYNIAAVMKGVKERSGSDDNPHILSFLASCSKGAGSDDLADETPWCSAFVSWCCWLTRYERSVSLRARSWCKQGDSIPNGTVRVGDIAVLGRGKRPFAPAGYLHAPGHVAFVAEPVDEDSSSVVLLGGNQGNSVSTKRFPGADVLMYRRLRPLKHEPWEDNSGGRRGRAAEENGNAEGSIANLAARVGQIESFIRGLKEAVR